MCSSFQAKKLNDYKECDFAANQAEPENQAGLVPDPDPKKIYILFKKSNPPIPIHHRNRWNLDLESGW